MNTTCVWNQDEVSASEELLLSSFCGSLWGKGLGLKRYDESTKQKLLLDDFVCVR
jgi:hypothetical protein